ncbi:uncharacterized protein G2W53_024046 [Senna tora]|uniref:Uncharacterized protein n=1 Tax=Senna tora TaxID=362788 RepID=A0A834TC66_9FABA|nr:uncharacterized protein G2W53_024046 [Senna tora]
MLSDEQPELQGPECGSQLNSPLGLFWEHHLMESSRSLDQALAVVLVMIDLKMSLCSSRDGGDIAIYHQSVIVLQFSRTKYGLSSKIIVYLLNISSCPTVLCLVLNLDRPHKYQREAASALSEFSATALLFLSV